MFLEPHGAGGPDRAQEHLILAQPLAAGSAKGLLGGEQILAVHVNEFERVIPGTRILGKLQPGQYAPAVGRHEVRILFVPGRLGP